MEEGPDMEMRGVAEMGMGEFAESREKGGVSRRGVVEAHSCRDFWELRLRASLSQGESQEGLWRGDSQAAAMRSCCLGSPDYVVLFILGGFYILKMAKQG